MTVAEYTIESVESSPFAQNSYILWRHGRQDAVVIDPGFDTKSILEISMVTVCILPPSSTRTAMRTISPAMIR